ncbi:RNA recognition motif domain [Trinorchestia longiramus]|nr:RNA recognition motif domain [Trinorchestia longiramus]
MSGVFGRLSKPTHDAEDDGDGEEDFALELSVAPEELAEFAMDVEDLDSNKNAIETSSLKSYSPSSKHVQLGLEYTLAIRSQVGAPIKYQCILCFPNQHGNFIQQSELSKHLTTPRHLKSVLQLTNLKVYNDLQFLDDSHVLRNRLNKLVSAYDTQSVVTDAAGAAAARLNIKRDIEKKKALCREEFIKNQQNESSGSRKSVLSRLSPRSPATSTSVLGDVKHGTSALETRATNIKDRIMDPVLSSVESDAQTSTSDGSNSASKRRFVRDAQGNLWSSKKLAIEGGDGKPTPVEASLATSVKCLAETSSAAGKTAEQVMSEETGQEASIGPGAQSSSESTANKSSPLRSEDVHASIKPTSTVEILQAYLQLGQSFEACTSSSKSEVTSKPDSVDGKSQLTPAAGTRPQLTPAAGARPQLTPAAGARPQLTPAAGARPQLTPAAGARPQLTPAAGARPQLTPATGARPQLTPAAGARPQLTPAAGARPQLTPAAGARPQLTPAAGARPQLTPAAGARPQLTPAAGARPQLTPAAGARPQLTPAAGARPQLTPAAGARPRLTPAAGARPQPQLTSSAGARPQLTSSAGARPQLTPSAGARPQLTPSAGARPQLTRPIITNPRLGSTSTSEPELNRDGISSIPVSTQGAKPQQSLAQGAEPELLQSNLPSAQPTKTTFPVNPNDVPCSASANAGVPSSSTQSVTSTGTVTTSTSSVTTSTGTVTTSTGTVTTSTGTVTTSTGTVTTSTGTVTTSTGSVTTSTGSVTTSTGSVATSTGSVASALSGPGTIKSSTPSPTVHRAPLLTSPKAVQDPQQFTSPTTSSLKTPASSPEQKTGMSLLFTPMSRVFRKATDSSAIAGNPGSGKSSLFATPPTAAEGRVTPPLNSAGFSVFVSNIPISISFMLVKKMAAACNNLLSCQLAAGTSGTAKLLYKDLRSATVAAKTFAQLVLANQHLTVLASASVTAAVNSSANVNRTRDTVELMVQKSISWSLRSQHVGYRWNQMKVEITSYPSDPDEEVVVQDDQKTASENGEQLAPSGASGASHGDSLSATLCTSPARGGPTLGRGGPTLGRGGSTRGRGGSTLDRGGTTGRGRTAPGRGGATFDTNFGVAPIDDSNSRGSGFGSAGLRGRGNTRGGSAATIARGGSTSTIARGGSTSTAVIEGSKSSISEGEFAMGKPSGLCPPDMVSETTSCSRPLDISRSGGASDSPATSNASGGFVIRPEKGGYCQLNSFSDTKECLTPTASVVAPAPSRGAPAASRGAPAASRGAPAASRGAPAAFRGAPSSFRGAPGSSRGGFGASSASAHTSINVMKTPRDCNESEDESLENRRQMMSVSSILDKFKESQGTSTHSSNEGNRIGGATSTPVAEKTRHEAVAPATPKPFSAPVLQGMRSGNGSGPAAAAVPPTSVVRQTGVAPQSMSFMSNTGSSARPHDSSASRIPYTSAPGKSILKKSSSQLQPNVVAEVQHPEQNKVVIGPLITVTFLMNDREFPGVQQFLYSKLNSLLSTQSLQERVSVSLTIPLVASVNHSQSPTSTRVIMQHKNEGYNVLVCCPKENERTHRFVLQVVEPLLQAGAAPIFSQGVGWFLKLGKQATVITTTLLHEVRLLDTVVTSHTLHSASTESVVVGTAMLRAQCAVLRSCVKLYNTEVTKLLCIEFQSGLDITTYKVKRCVTNCGRDDCINWHTEAERRRNPKEFTYSRQRCPGEPCRHRGDTCPHSRTLNEQLMHPQSFLVNVCSTAHGVAVPQCRQDGLCSKAHSGSPDLLYNNRWCDQYLSGLEKSFIFLAGAIRNLFLLPKGTERVVFVTSEAAVAEAAVKLIKPLTDLHGVRVSLHGTRGGDVVIGTPQALTSLAMENVHALILDDASKLLLDPLFSPCMSKLACTITMNQKCRGAKKLCKVLVASSLDSLAIEAAKKIFKVSDFRGFFSQSGILDVPGAGELFCNKKSINSEDVLKRSEKLESSGTAKTESKKSMVGQHRQLTDQDVKGTQDLPQQGREQRNMPLHQHEPLQQSSSADRLWQHQKPELLQHKMSPYQQHPPLQRNEPSPYQKEQLRDQEHLPPKQVQSQSFHSSLFQQQRGVKRQVISGNRRLEDQFLSEGTTRWKRAKLEESDERSGYTSGSKWTQATSKNAGSSQAFSAEYTGKKPEVGERGVDGWDFGQFQGKTTSRYDQYLRKDAWQTREVTRESTRFGRGTKHVGLENKEFDRGGRGEFDRKDQWSQEENHFDRGGDRWCSPKAQQPPSITDVHSSRRGQQLFGYDDKQQFCREDKRQFETGQHLVGSEHPTDGRDHLFRPPHEYFGSDYQKQLTRPNEKSYDRQNREPIYGCGTKESLENKDWPPFGDSKNKQPFHGSGYKQSSTDYKDQQPLGGSRDQQLFGGFADQKMLDGSVDQKPFSGYRSKQLFDNSSVPQPLRIPTGQPPFGGLKNRPPFGDLKDQPPLGGSREQQPFEGSRDREQLSGYRNQQSFGGSKAQLPFTAPRDQQLFDNSKGHQSGGRSFDYENYESYDPVRQQKFERGKLQQYMNQNKDINDPNSKFLSGSENEHRFGSKSTHERGQHDLADWGAGCKPPFGFGNTRPFGLNYEPQCESEKQSGMGPKFERDQLHSCKGNIRQFKTDEVNRSDHSEQRRFGGGNMEVNRDYGNPIGHRSNTQLNKYGSTSGEYTQAKSNFQQTVGQFLQGVEQSETDYKTKDWHRGQEHGKKEFYGEGNDPSAVHWKTEPFPTPPPPRGGQTSDTSYQTSTWREEGNRPADSNTVIPNPGMENSAWTWKTSTNPSSGRPIETYSSSQTSWNKSQHPSTSLSSGITFTHDSSIGSSQQQIASESVGQLSSSVAPSDGFSMLKAWQALEALTPYLSHLSSSLSALITVARRRGSDTLEACELIVQKDHVNLINLCLADLESQMKYTPPSYRPKLREDIRLGEQLIKHAQSRVYGSSREVGDDGAHSLQRPPNYGGQYPARAPEQNWSRKNENYDQSQWKTSGTQSRIHNAVLSAIMK